MPDTVARRPPAALTAAVAIVVAETVAEAAFVVIEGSYGAIAKVFVLLVLAAKIAFAVSARRLRAGSAVAVLLFELVGILVALGADWALAVRLGLVTCVVAVFVLVLSSLHAFPSPELP